MKQLVFVIALAAVFLLSACAGISIIYKDAPGAASPAVPSTGAEPSAEASPPIPAESPGSGQTAPAPDDGETPPPDGGTVQKPEGTSGGTGEIPAVIPDISAPPSAGAAQPPLLTEMVQKAGLSFGDIGYSQLILVAAEGAAAGIYCYDKDDNGIWKFNESTGYIKGHVGKNGVTDDKREGDGCTPAGLFPLGYAFGNSAKPATGMTWRAVTDTSYWVDDPDSAYYNQWVEGAENADWDSAEKLSEMPKYYAYAVVVEYNTEKTVAGKGSAVFLHCKTIPTSGCIAAPQEDILKILKWLSEEKNPGILILER